MIGIIIGAGVTGLSAGLKNGCIIYEANSISGGICASYYVGLDGRKYYHRENEETYRFEIGGGHWIFGADNEILNFINSLSPTKKYERNSAVYFPDWDLYVPYPLQNHLFYLPKDIREKALQEIMKSENKDVNTMAEWLEINFGKTLCEIFFFPFHELYTAGLYKKIAPQDKYKTPVNKELILKGAKEKTPPVGYNATFVYPEKGLDDLISKIEKNCKVKYSKKAVEINLKKKEITFSDGTSVKFEKLISTIPLNNLAKIAKISIDEPEPPYTSVLVINIGAKKGKKCPEYHWIYIPKSKAGFHRVGFYSNVDASFLPLLSRKDNDRVSIYVEMAFQGGTKLSDEKIKQISHSVVNELQEWKFVEEVEVVDPTWIEVAYTWEWPNSNWVEKALDILRKNDIYSIGRYGKWKFQGIAESIKDGFEVKI